MLIVGLVIGAGAASGLIFGLQSGSSGHGGSAAPSGHAATTAAKAAFGSLHVVGTLTLDSTSTVGDGTSCSGTGGYSDITSGAEVVISDDSGSTLAITQLSSGSGTTGTECRWAFTANVPSGKGFYGVTVTHRGIVKYPESEMGDVGLTLGDGS